VLALFAYDHKDKKALGEVDAKICAGPEIWDA
jgi:hypothetical protein